MSNLLGLEEERQSTGEYDNVDLGPDPEWAARVKRGANWFYWIAGLSVVNTLAFVAGAQVHFLGGLGVVELVNGIIEYSIQDGQPAFLRAFSIAFTAVAIVGLALAGYFANKFFRIAFLLGIIVYAFDGLIVLLLGDYFMAAFHAFALYSLIRGYLACRELTKHLKVQADTALPKPPPPPPPAFEQQ